MCIHTLTVEVDFQLTVDLVCLSSYVEWLQLPGTVLGMGHAVASKKKKISVPHGFIPNQEESPDRNKYAVVCTGQKYFGKSLLGSWE